MDLKQLSIASIKALALDMISSANSGHPGMALGSAPIMYTLFSEHLRNDPRHPEFINRDRFILSAGHASALLYATLHLSGFDIPISELKAFRKLGSITPGHPEVKLTPGVDATTGPLGQGIAQAVGMALAERTLKSIYPTLNLIDHYTYVLLGDGCLQEGLSQEAISFAGHQKLNKLIMIYDSNDVTLDGPLSQSFSEDVSSRFIASGWSVISVSDGLDVASINRAIKKAKKSTNRPTLIIVKTIIGQGSLNQGTYKVHGSPLAKDDIEQIKQSLHYHYAPFEVPSEVYGHFKDNLFKRSKAHYNKYQRNIRKLIVNHHPDINNYLLGVKGDIKDVLDKVDMSFANDYKDATRNTSLQILNKLHDYLPFLVGGSADVSKSVMTNLKQSPDMSAEVPYGRNINFGIREFMMASVQNGMILHGGLKTFVGSFLVFADYMKPALRLGALSHIPSVYLFSHDSIALGEDGPTHQPIEHLAMLRSIPNFNVLRPADAKETWGSYLVALNETTSPTAIILSRQGLPLIDKTDAQLVRRGAYVVSNSKKREADLIIIASGSELSLALKVKSQSPNIDIKVVSMVSMNLFDQQTSAYQKRVLGIDKSKILSIEALSSFGWAKYADHHISIDTFGASGSGPEVYKHFGFNVDHIKEVINKIRNV